MNAGVGRARVRSWYTRWDTGEIFQVVGYDEESRTIEIQSHVLHRALSLSCASADRVRGGSHSARVKALRRLCIEQQGLIGRWRPIP